jgi:hypothetical protein
MRTFIAAATFIAALCIYATALADAAGVPVNASIPPVMIWGLVAALIAHGGTFAMKKLGGFAFFHTGVGSLVLAAVAAVVASVGLSLKNGWNTTSILFAAGNGLLNFLITANGENTMTAMAMKAKKAGAKVAAAAVLILAFMGLGAPSCQDFKTCELNALPSTVQTVILTVFQIAMDPSKTIDDLGQAVSSLSPTQGPCVIAAVSKYIDGKLPTHGQASPDLVAAASKLHSYLAAHPASACNGFPARM